MYAEIRSRDHQTSYQEDPRFLWYELTPSRRKFHEDDRDPAPFVGFFSTGTLPDVLVCGRVPDATVLTTRSGRLLFSDMAAANADVGEQVGDNDQRVVVGLMP